MINCPFVYRNHTESNVNSSIQHFELINPPVYSLFEFALKFTIFILFVVFLSCFYFILLSLPASRVSQMESNILKWLVVVYCVLLIMVILVNQFKVIPSSLAM